jgi:SAM-dependent methyltransferase
MLDYARARIPDPGIVWQTADAQALPFSGQSFDAAVCQFGVMFVPDKALAFREVRRVLRPGGRLVFNVWCELARNPFGRIARDTVARFFASDPPTFYDTPFGFHDQSVIRGLLADAGFEVSTCEVVTLQARSPTALDLARGAVTGNPVIRDVEERASAPAEVIIEAVAAALAAAGGSSPLRLPMQALVVVAQAG